MSSSRTDFSASGWRQFFARHGQRLVSLYFFANILGFIAWQTRALYAAGKLDFIEISFIVQNLVIAAVVLARREHFALDRNIWRQLIALAAFFSGVAFIGQPQTGEGAVMTVAQAVILVANFLGIVCVVNLGKSFGVLIACRGVKTTGLYGWVRHPMYGSDILLRIGYVLTHFTVFTVTALVLSSACYVYRALLEERFLAQQDEYRDYMRRVHYRFIPFLF
jgi:protein-S-isoprenylcysteine O-methyltransferase Ste14